jgi:hypothetical protein
MTALGNLPLYFEANLGQANSPAQFLARGRDCQFLISPNESRLILCKTDAISGKVSSCAVRMQFVNANAQAQIRGDAEQPGKINYLIGNDPAQWRTGVATFAQVRVEQLYPGIGLIYYGNQQQLEYDFTIAPHANPEQIAIQFAGMDKISVGPRGELILTIGKDEIRQPKPLLYQTVNGARAEISGSYKIVDAHTVAFDIGKYNRALPLVIDPILSYSTYFGGNAGETAWAVSMDANGFIYVAGQTFSTQFSTPGAYQTNYHGGIYAGDAFIAKFDNLGTNLIYLTYLGGSGNDAAYGLAVDGAGDAYVTGFTDSVNFPTTNAIPGYTNISGTLDTHVGLYPADVFVAELNPGGSNLIYSTYLGGNSSDAAYGIAVDSLDNAYVTGFTYSTNFPTTNAIQNHLACTNSFYNNANAFVTEIASNGASLVFSTYFGGTNYDLGKSIAVDASGIYVTGFTASTNFPTTNALVQQLILTNGVGTNQIFITNYIWNGYLLNGSTNLTSTYDAFVAKFAPSGTNLIYSTFLGGTNSDVANGIAVDGFGNAYVTGWTTSTNFPNTAANVIPNYLANNSLYGYIITTNAFLTQIQWNGTNATIGYSAPFGGSVSDVGYGVAVDSYGNAFVVGATSSANFPAFNTSGFLRATNSGGNDVFVIAFYANASGLLYSAYLGGLSDDFGYGIVLDPTDNAYIVGQTASANFPTLDARQTALNGVNDAFLAKILLQQPALTLTKDGGNVILAWPAFEPEFILESNTNLVSSNTWVTVPLSFVLINGFETITLPATNSDLFFRLHKF